MIAVTDVPKWLEYFSVGWFLYHALLIALAFYVGFSTGRKIKPPKPPILPPSRGR